MPEATDGITDAQLRKLGAIMGDLGVTGTGSRERRLAIAARVAGRKLGSSKDLDTLEANGAQIIAEMDAATDGQPPAVEVAQAAAATVDEQIAAARADADARAAQWDAEQAQADDVDPTLGAEWPA